MLICLGRWGRQLSVLAMLSRIQRFARSSKEQQLIVDVIKFSAKIDFIIFAYVEFFGAKLDEFRILCFKNGISNLYKIQK